MGTTIYYEKKRKHEGWGSVRRPFFLFLAIVIVIVIVIIVIIWL